MVKKPIVDVIRRYFKILAQEGLEPSFGVVFGSQVNGDIHKWSDIDILVVSPQLDKKRRYKEVALLWGVAALVDSRIEPIPCGEVQWLEDDGIPIIEIARREGEIVYA